MAVRRSSCLLTVSLSLPAFFFRFLVGVFVIIKAHPWDRVNRGPREGWPREPRDVWGCGRVCCLDLVTLSQVWLALVSRGPYAHAICHVSVLL